jgi:hypothetical protein
MCGPLLFSDRTMQLLIGYLMALAVFLGGGYAGAQWLLAPDNRPALAENSRAESASSRLINAKKIRDARALHRRLAESLAEEGVKPAAARNESDVVVADGEERAAKIADHPDTRAAADAPQDAAPPQVPGATVAASDPKLDARAEVGSAATPEKTKAVHNESDARQRPGGKTGAERVARKSAEAKAGPASEPAAARSDAPINKKQAVSKKKRAERFASSSRKPVMMILRTIEFPDGRREQRLLPMSQARSGLARYESISAFADDDDF